MPPLVENTAAPAEAVTHQPAEGEQPPIEQATPVAQRDEPTKEEKARALLQGDPPKDAKPDPNDEQAMLDAQFDPETGELLDEDPAATQEEQPAEAEGEETPAEDSESPEAEAGEEDEEPDGGDRKARRIRIKRDSLSDRDFAILTLSKDKRISFEEAALQLFGDAPRKEELAQPEAAARNHPTAQQIVETMNALRAQRDAASNNFEVGRVNALNDQITELRDLLTHAKGAGDAQAQNQRQIASQKYATAETAAIHRVTELYPEASSAGSKLNDAMQAKAADYRKQEPQFFQNPKWPMLLAVETATELGIAAKVKGQAGKPALKAAPLVIPKKTTRPAPTPAPGTATGARTNTEAALRDELSAAKANRDVEGIKAVMRKLTAAG
jgi:hypothetical protein